MNEKTDVISMRISEEEKERLLLEAEARDITLSDLLKEIIAKKTGKELLGKDLMARKKGIELSKEACPFCGTEVDWRIVKTQEPFLFIFGESGKHCPSCDELVYAYSEKEGWQKREPESEEEEKEEDDSLY